MAEKKSLEFIQKIDSPMKQVYQAFAGSVAFESWFSDSAEADVRKGGRFYAWWNEGYYTSGQFTKVKENERIAFTWFGFNEPAPTKVNVAFKEDEGATLVKVSHKGIGKGKVWKKTNQQISEGWETALANLKSVVETGYDKRLYDQPMLGVLPSGMVDKKMVTEFNLPVETGAKISDVVAGMGAEAAGLQGEDIIYSIGGQKLKTFPDFGLAMSGKKAGDVVEVVYYRGGERLTTDMKLSGRPKPELPSSAKELAERTAKVYEEVNKEMDALFEAVTEDQASARPGDEEWSAKEVLAHLIYSERWLHLAITCFIGNFRTGGFSNDLGMHAAIADAYPLEELIAELKRCEAITVSAIEALPEEFIADKRRLLILTANVDEQGFALHTRGHFPQIEAALKVSKQS
ncbi:MAG: SRPBCC domain-containing protein [Anaerolineales bacterium]|nr:SRPBCC domain-containing protein [Anaerolineales bacterium]